LRGDKPCQDAIYLSPPNENFVIACVADGHGSSSCPYSADGAEAAVKIAGELLEQMLPNLQDHKEIWLPKHIEAEWKKTVETIHGEQGREEPFAPILYGTTLIAVAATDSFVFALQIGDGNILMVDESGAARPILSVAENVGEDTESLCLKEAWKYVRTQFIPTDETKGLFMLSTDGYANSFATGAGFLKAGADFYSLWQEEGLSFIEEELSGWLRLSSDKGSGDDIALALVVR